MKKMNALFAALTLAVTALTPMVSSATEITFNGKVNHMDVSKKYDSYYTLVIPADIKDVDANEGLTLEANAFLHYDEKLVVSVTSNNGWELRDTNTGNTNYVGYKMKKGEKVLGEGANDILDVAFSDEGQTGSVTLTMNTVDEPVYAGTYTDTLTFTARAENIEKTEEANTTTASKEDSGSEETTTTTTAPAEGGGA